MKLPENIKKITLAKTLGISLLSTLFLFSACGSNNPSQPGGTVFSSDDTEQAVELVREANSELKKIKKIYRENEGKIEELQSAMTAKENAKVKQIADDLVFKINDGIMLGDSAISKLEDAKNLNINNTFRSYLIMKSTSLKKQLEAFEYRRQAAELLSKGFSGSDSKQIDGIKAVFKDKEVEFQKAWQDGRDESLEANDYYKESNKPKP